MAVTVCFRGICLFVIRGDHLQEVLLPEAEDGKPREDKSGNHVDASGARKHFAGMLLPPDKKSVKIKKTAVTIAGRGAHGPDPGQLDNLPRLSGDLGMPAELVLDGSMARTTITVTGEATITTKRAGNGTDFTFLNQGIKDDQVDIIFDDPVTITIGSRKIDLNPADNRRVYFFNFDDAEPDETMLEDGNPASGTAIHDHDFKWLYLLAAPPGSDPKKLEKWAGGSELPCPISEFKSGPGIKTMAAPATISGSTCYPATFTE